MNYGKGTEDKCFAWSQSPFREREQDEEKRFAGENSMCCLIAWHVRWRMAGDEACSGVGRHCKKAFSQATGHIIL